MGTTRTGTNNWYRTCATFMKNNSSSLVVLFVVALIGCFQLLSLSSSSSSSSSSVAVRVVGTASLVGIGGDGDDDNDGSSSCPKSKHYMSTIHHDVNFGAYCDNLYFTDTATLEAEVDRISKKYHGDTKLLPVVGLLCQERNYSSLVTNYERDARPAYANFGACYGQAFDPDDLINYKYQAEDEENSCPTSKHYLSMIVNDVNFGTYCDELYFPDAAAMESEVDRRRSSKGKHPELKLTVLGMLCKDRNFPSMCGEYNRDHVQIVTVGACYGKTFNPP